MFVQMASTAAGVAVGSTVGHGLSSMLFGGKTEASPAPVEQQSFEDRRMGGTCEIQAKGKPSFDAGRPGAHTPGQTSRNA